MEKRSDAILGRITFREFSQKTQERAWPALKFLAIRFLNSTVIDVVRFVKKMLKSRIAQFFGMTE
jgi:hypothetical protein